MRIFLTWQLFFVLLLLCCPDSYADKQLVAYVGGVNEVVKIDLSKSEITKSLIFPGGGHIVFGLNISNDGKELFATGDMFSAPLIVIDSKTLKITKSGGEKIFKDLKTDLDFMCRGKLSPDGNRFAIDCGIDSGPFLVIDPRTFKSLNKPLPIHSNPIYQAIFSADNKFLYVLTGLQIKEKKTIYKNKIVIISASTGKVLKESILPKFENIKCETNTGDYISDNADIFITCNKNFYDSHSSNIRGLLKGDEIYPSISEIDLKKIKLIEVKTGTVIDEVPTPDGRGDLNTITLTPDGKKLLIGRGGYRHPGELTIVDVKSKKIIKRIMLEGGATSNVVFGYE